MHDLLHPPAHRGPLIAAGALLLAVGVALLQARLAWGPGAHLVVLLALAAGLLWLGLQAPGTGGAPYPHQSVLIVLGLAASAAALARLADVVGDLPPGAGTLVWTSLLEAGLATFVSVRRRSAVAALIAAVAGGTALLAAWDWVFDPASVTPFRWLLLLLMVAYALASLPLRGESQRHAEQMVNAAGLAVLAIGLSGASLFAIDLPSGWQVAVLAGGASLVAYAAADRAAGAAYLGAANLAVFILTAGTGDSVLWWPLILLALGGLMLLAGLRPRRPLPPEPDASTHPDDQPLSVRVEGR